MPLLFRLFMLSKVMRKIHDKQECQDVVIQQDQRTPKRRQLQSPTEKEGKKKKKESQEIENADTRKNPKR